ncbi:Not1-domain-containing protein [Rhizopus microsporus]|uniref:Not1-domain-containing protein n=1 Tax=Rhizopus microsporus TaxID=58291 RepID=A0A1X0S2M7_RHIZD|nr:Not1-domain-containing protein [Rhizopus microsporus]
MKLYDMFSQKQITPPPNLPLASNSTYIVIGLFNISTNFQQDVFTTKIEQMLIELNRLVNQAGDIPFSLLPPHHDVILVMRQIPLLINQSSTPLLLYSVVERVMCQLYQSTTPLAIEVYCRFLQILMDLSATVSKDILSWILYSDDPRKYNARVMSALIKSGLVRIEEFDTQLSKQLDQSQDPQLIEFAVTLLRLCMLMLHPISSIDDHLLTIRALTRLDHALAKELIQELEGQWTAKYKNPKNDTFTLRLLFAEWIRLYKHALTANSTYHQFAKKIMKTVTNNPDRMCFFFRLCTEVCVELYQSTKSHCIDAYSKLVSNIIRINQDSIKISCQVLSITVLVIAEHHEKLGTQFNQKPFLKLLGSLFIELNNVNDRESFIGIYGDVLYTLRPLKFPGFAYSWLQLFSHRLFLPLLLKEENEGWTICYKLMSALLSFITVLLTPTEEPARLSRSAKAFYQGSLRFLVVMLHDYPEFLCEHYFSFIQLLPLSCVQLRNVILSAFPRTMILPDPFTISLGYVANNTTKPKLLQMKEEDALIEIGAYLTTKQSKMSIGNSLVSYISSRDEKQTCDVERIQRLVFYVGSHTTVDTKKPLSENPAIQIYKYLLAHFSSTGNSFGQYALLNCIADHLRYPNSHTYFFSMAILHLFNSQSQQIKEQITRQNITRKADSESTSPMGPVNNICSAHQRVSF